MEKSMSKNKIVWFTYGNLQDDENFTVSGFPKNEYLHVALLETIEERAVIADRLYGKNFYGVENHTFDDLFEMIEMLANRIVIKHSDAKGIVLPVDSLIALHARKVFLDAGLEIKTYAKAIRVRLAEPIFIFEF